jgi:hypothetical protein
LRYENIFINISQTSQGEESDRLQSRCIEENNLITKINERLLLFINNKCKAEELKTRVSEILYDNRKGENKGSSRNISLQEEDYAAKEKFRTVPVDTRTPVTQPQVARKTSEEVRKTEKVEKAPERSREQPTRGGNFVEEKKPETPKVEERKVEEPKPVVEKKTEERRTPKEPKIEQKPFEQKKFEQPKPVEVKKPDPKPEERKVAVQETPRQVQQSQNPEFLPSFANETFKDSQFKDYDPKKSSKDEDSEGFNFDYASEGLNPADFGGNPKVPLSNRSQKTSTTNKPPIAVKLENINEKDVVEFDNPFKKDSAREKTSRKVESPKRSNEEQQEFADELLKRTQRSDPTETQRLKSERDKVYDELTRIRKDYNDLMMEYEGMKNSNQNINKDFNKVRDELEALKDKYKVTSDTKEQLTKENEDYERLRQNLFRERNYLMDSMESLNNEILRIRSRLNNYESKNGNARRSEDPRIMELVKVLDDAHTQYEKMHVLFEKVLGDRILTNEEHENLKNFDFKNQTQNLTERVQDIANQSRTYSPSRQVPRTSRLEAEEFRDFPNYKAPVRSPKYSSGSNWFNPPADNTFSDRQAFHSPSPIRVPTQSSQYTLRSPFAEKFQGPGSTPSDYSQNRSPIRTLVEYKEYKPNPKTIQYVSKTEKTRKTLGSMGPLSSLGSGARIQYFNDNYQDLPTFAKETEPTPNIITRSREVRNEINYTQTLPNETKESFFTQRQLSPIRTVPTDHSVRLNTDVLESQDLARQLDTPIQVFTESHQFENITRTRKALSRRESLSSMKPVSTTTEYRPPLENAAPRPEVTLNIVSLPQVVINNEPSNPTRESTQQLSTASFQKEPLTTLQYINNLKQISPNRSSITASFPNTINNSGQPGTRENSPPRFSIPSVNPLNLYIPPSNPNSNTGSIREPSPNRFSVQQSDSNTPSKPIVTSSIPFSSVTSSTPNPNNSVNASTSSIMDLIDKQLARSRLAGSGSKEPNQTNVLEPGAGKTGFDYSKTLPPSYSSASLKKILVSNPLTENTSRFNPSIVNMKSFAPMPSSSSAQNILHTFNPVSDLSTIRVESPTNTTTRFNFNDYVSRSPEKKESAKEPRVSSNTLNFGSPGTNVGDSFLSKGDIVQVTRTQYRDPMESMMKNHKLDDSMKVKEIRNVPQVKFSASNL